MHVHPTLPNPYAQLDALRSAQRAAARREAARVRKELIESASELAADSDFSDLSVTQVEEREESRKQFGGNRRNVRQSALEQAPADSEDAGMHVSDWA